MTLRVSGSTYSWPRRPLRSVWLRAPDEVTACPTCASFDIRAVDVISIPRRSTGRAVAFVSGCRDCGLLFTNPLPSPEELERFYAPGGTWASAHTVQAASLELEHEKRARKQKPLKKKSPHTSRGLLLDALAPHVPVYTPPSGAKVLDVGCGDGQFLDRFQDHGWKTYGIEPSTTVAFLRHVALEAPPQDQSFDLVLVRHVLEHLADPLSLLRQITGAVRPRGALFISVPRLDTLAEHRDLRYCLNSRTHIVGFSLTCLEGLLARAGFELTVCLSRPELDDALTEGKPLWLHVLATRAVSPAVRRADALKPALEALRRYHKRDGRWRLYARSLVPVRLRAAWMERVREREARGRRGARG
jgi:2-polyprenyl-3-methyl-5-hydroxy-6-metoxy-1,4-benzoquinol methylase